MMRQKMLGAAVAAMLFAPGAVWAQGATSETYKQLNLFGDVFERVRADYVEDTPDSKLIEAAIRGMLSALDPHSGYLSPKNAQAMRIQTRGEFGGLGIEVSQEGGLVKVIAPIDGTPAARAGIQPGDLITHIDGDSVQDMTLNDAVDKMRGPVNTQIKLTIKRGSRDPFDVSITRDVIRIRSVRSRLEGDIGYVRITTFNEQTTEGLEDAVKTLRKDAGEKLSGVILDLRNNPGGLLDQAISVSDAFLEKGEIVSTRGRRPEDTQRFNAKPGDIAKGLPVVVLINGGSASASEIVAGALSDHKRAIVLGTRSFGKGSVQTVIPLGEYGAMRLTTARYYTPSGRSIQATGIDPDIIVEQARLQVVDEDGSRRESELRGALDVGRNQPGEGHGTVSAERQTDYQLARAIDLLRGIHLYSLQKLN
jgi:carboxyl-terminal processing protease